MIMDVIKSFSSWFNTPRYEPVRSGFHPFQQDGDKYSATGPYDPPKSKESDFLVSEVNVPAWSSILSLYPSIKSDPSFNAEKLGMTMPDY